MPATRDLPLVTGEQLLYGRVAANVRPPADAMMYRVPVEVAAGQFQDLLSTQVYSFRSGAQAVAVIDAAIDPSAFDSSPPVAEGSEESTTESVQVQILILQTDAHTLWQ